MRKTYVLFGLAVTLFLVAVALGLPREAPPPPPTPEPAPRAIAEPMDTVTLGRHVTLSGALSNAHVLAGSPGQLSLLVELDAAEIEARARPPMAIALVVDRSGSMAGGKIIQAKRAAKALVERLSDEDQISIVTYSSDYATDLALTRVKGQRARILRTIDDILDGGGTNLAGGLTSGIQALRGADPSRARRVLLLSDGNANQGLTNPTAIADLAGEARQRGITVSTLGIGVDFNEDLMTQIAQAAGGGYYYARNAQAIAAAFDAEMNGLMNLAARGVEVGLELAPGVRIEEVLGYRTEVRGGRTVIPVGDMAAGAHRQILLTLDVAAATEGARPVANVVLGYQHAQSGDAAEHQGALSVSAVTDAARVSASARDEVVEAVVTARAAKARDEAARVFAQGDADRARQRVRGSLDRLRKQNQALKSPKVARQVQEMERTLDQLSNTRFESEAGKDLVKREKLRAYESFVY